MSLQVSNIRKVTRESYKYPIYGIKENPKTNLRVIFSSLYLDIVDHFDRSVAANKWVSMTMAMATFTVKAYRKIHTTQLQ